MLSSRGFRCPGLLPESPPCTLSLPTTPFASEPFCPVPPSHARPPASAADPRRHPAPYGVPGATRWRIALNPLQITSPGPFSERPAPVIVGESAPQLHPPPYMAQAQVAGHPQGRNRFLSAAARPDAPAAPLPCYLFTEFKRDVKRCTCEEGWPRSPIEDGVSLIIPALKVDGQEPPSCLMRALTRRRCESTAYHPKEMATATRKRL